MFVAAVHVAIPLLATGRVDRTPGRTHTRGVSHTSERI